MEPAACTAVCRAARRCRMPHPPHAKRGGGAAEGGRMGAFTGTIMIDHVSIAVRDLAASATFYDSVLGAVGYARLVERPATVGFGKTYSEFWLNHRPDMATVVPE